LSLLLSLERSTLARPPPEVRESIFDRTVVVKERFKGRVLGVLKAVVALWF
jgi:hypothetical protein